MPWSPLPQLAFAICTHPFVPSAGADLPLQIGDELYIIEEGGKNGSWYRGYLVAPPSLLAGLTSSRGQTLEKRVFTGIFPRACVEVKEFLGDVTDHTNDATDTQSSSGKIPSTSKHVFQGSSAEQVESSVKVHTINGNASKSNHPGALSPASATSSASTVDSSNASAVSARKPPAPVPMLKIGDESPFSKEEPLVDEIASCLREWHSTKLHELLLNQEYESLEKLSLLVTRLDYTRKQLFHKVLTEHELIKLRETAIWDLVAGNKMLGQDVIVRSTAEKGRILTCEDPATKIYQLQASMSLLEERPESQPESRLPFHAYLNLKNFTSHSDKATTLTLSLYSKRQGDSPKLISEHYAVDATTPTPGITFSFEGARRTLFTDIAPIDVGENVSEKNALFLVVKMITAEPAASNVTYPSRSATPNHDGYMERPPHLNPAWRSGSFKGGRQSLMWGRKGRKDSEGSIKAGQSRPDTANPPSPTKGSFRPENTLGSTSRSKPVKRLTALGVLDVTTHVSSLEETELAIPVQAPDKVVNGQEHHDENIEEVVRWVLGTEISRAPVANTGGLLTLQWKAFRDANSDNLIQETPTLLHGVTISPRLGFTGAPTKPRSDIYLNMRRPVIQEHASLSHPKFGSVALPDEKSIVNLQLTLEVRNAAGNRIENCIFPSSNISGHTAWRTIAAERGECWHQTIRLAIPPDDVPGSHIVMSLAEGYEFPFALCWMPLWIQDAFIRDNEHALALYRYDEITSSTTAGRGAYLSLPWNSHAKDVTVTGHPASVLLTTYLCSTAYSQDPNLLNLLRWRELDYEEVCALLKGFSFVSEIEVVKLLKDVFNALFGIIVEYAGRDELEDYALQALVFVLGIVHDRRFNLQPLVDSYAENDFNYPFACPCLVRSFSRLLENPTSGDNARQLRSACKVGAYILQFIVKARQQQVQKEVGIGIQSHRPTFAKDVEPVFMATTKLMRDADPVLVGTKTLLVQNFHDWLPELSGVTTSTEMLELASQFIDSCEGVQGRLVLFELLLIKHICEANLFKETDAQDAWLSNVERWLDPHWGSIDVEAVFPRERIRLCCSVVSTLFELHGSETSAWTSKLIQSYKTIQSLSRPASSTFSMLFPSTYPFPTRPTNSVASYDEALVEIVALCAGTSSITPHGSAAISTTDLETMFIDILRVARSVLDFEAFPSTWLSVHVFSHTSLLQSFENMYDILCARFLPTPEDATEFNDGLWKSYLTTLLKLVASDALALETFPEQKRRAVWKIAGDIREAGADLLETTWQSLGWDTQQDEQDLYGLERMGGYQVSYVPSLVKPIMELCLSVHEGLRNVAIGILHTMIVSEWTLNDNLAVIQTAMIDNLDQLYKSKPMNDGMLQKQFLEELRRRFEGLTDRAEKSLYRAVIALLDTISELFDLLVAVYAPENTGDTTQILDTLRLLQYLKDMDKVEIYIGYVYKLARIQRDSKHLTEAGLALKLHADLHPWDIDEQLPPIDDLDLHYPAQSAFDRKEQIYFQMVQDFEEASDWHQALAIYEELALQYQTNIYDFAKLARTQRAMATIYEKIGAGGIQQFRFFRVYYRGLGFPSSIRDKQYVFQSGHQDKLASFTDRMQQQYPAARIVSGGALDEIEGQYLSIYPISIQRDFSHPVVQRLKTAQSVKEHLMLRSPRHFANTTRRQAADSSGVKSQVQEKVFYTTAEAFPTITQRSEIVSSQAVRLTPVQIGLERTTRKTQELQVLVHAVPDGGESALKALTENLMILINKNSQGSVADYWDLVADDVSSPAIDGEGENSRDSGESSKALEEALRVVLMDHVLAIRNALEMFSRGAHLATKAELTRGETIRPICSSARLQLLTAS